jgi:hypothetical protein
MVYYVGSTTATLKTRLQTGHGAKTSIELRYEGLTPAIEAIEECPAVDRYRLEVYWICQFRAWGFTLDNKAYNNRTFLSGYNNDKTVAKKNNAITKLRIMLEAMELDEKPYLTSKIITAVNKMYSEAGLSVKHINKYKQAA